MYSRKKCAERRKAENNLLYELLCNNLLRTSLSPCLSPLLTHPLKFRESYLNELDSRLVSEKLYFSINWYQSDFNFNKLVSEPMANMMGQMPLPRLTKTNYENWSIQMKALLDSQDAWEVVEDGFKESIDTTGYTVAQNKTLKELQSKDKATLYMLFRAVDELGFEKIARETTSKEAWDTLEKVFKGTERVKQVRLQTLRGELESMKMNESKNVSDYITRVQTVANQLNRNEVILPETWVVEKILRSLTDNFENVVCAIEESKDLTNS